MSVERNNNDNFDGTIEVVQRNLAGDTPVDSSVDYSGNPVFFSDPIVDFLPQIDQTPNLTYVIGPKTTSETAVGAEYSYLAESQFREVVRDRLGARLVRTVDDNQQTGFAYFNGDIPGRENDQKTLFLKVETGKQPVRPDSDETYIKGQIRKGGLHGVELAEQIIREECLEIQLAILEGRHRQDREQVVALANSVGMGVTESKQQKASFIQSLQLEVKSTIAHTRGQTAKALQEIALFDLPNVMSPGEGVTVESMRLPETRASQVYNAAVKKVAKIPLGPTVSQAAGARQAVDINPLLPATADHSNVQMLASVVAPRTVQAAAYSSGERGHSKVVVAVTMGSLAALVLSACGGAFSTPISAESEKPVDTQSTQVIVPNEADTPVPSLPTPESVYPLDGKASDMELLHKFPQLAGRDLYKIAVGNEGDIFILGVSAEVDPEFGQKTSVGILCRTESMVCDVARSGSISKLIGDPTQIPPELQEEMEKQLGDQIWTINTKEGVREFLRLHKVGDNKFTLTYTDPDTDKVSQYSIRSEQISTKLWARAIVESTPESKMYASSAQEAVEQIAHFSDRADFKGPSGDFRVQYSDDALDKEGIKSIKSFQTKDFDDMWDWVIEEAYRLADKKEGEEIPLSFGTQIGQESGSVSFKGVLKSYRGYVVTQEEFDKTLEWVKDNDFPHTYVRRGSDAGQMPIIGYFNPEGDFVTITVSWGVNLLNNGKGGKQWAMFDSVRVLGSMLETMWLKGDENVPGSSYSVNEMWKRLGSTFTPIKTPDGKDATWADDSTLRVTVTYGD